MSAGLISPIEMGALIAALAYYVVFYFVIKLAVTSGVIKAEKKMAAEKNCSGIRPRVGR
jgi:uncharacterized protein (DUF2062 family)